MDITEILNTNIPKCLIENYKGDTDYINAGGCGFFALYLHRQLIKRGIKAKLVSLGKDWYYGDNNNSMSNRLISKGKDSIPNGHIMVQVGGKLYDSEGERAGRYKSLKEYGKVTPRLLNNLLRRRHKWNDEFDRSTRSSMKKSIKRAFKYK